MRKTAKWILPLRQAVASALRNDVVTLAQAAAYASMVALFPMLIVAAAAVARLPDATPLRAQMSLFFERVLPPDVVPLLGAYFTVKHHNPHTTQALLGSAVVAITGAAGVMATLMEGFRRAHGLPLPPGSFWPRRVRALALVPLSLVPMAVATALVMFGHLLTHWLASEVAAHARPGVRVLAYTLRWGIALAGSTAILAMIYHLGTDVGDARFGDARDRDARDGDSRFGDAQEPNLASRLSNLVSPWSWRASLPGAALATAMWFLCTLLFGFYVTRFANYSQVYGQLGAGVALMFWLFLIALSVLVGAEFNAQLAVHGPARRAAQTAALLWKTPGARRRKTGRMAD